MPRDLLKNLNTGTGQSFIGQMGRHTGLPLHDVYYFLVSILRLLTIFLERVNFKIEDIMRVSNFKSDKFGI